MSRRYLLDANLSPKIAYALRSEFPIDVVSLISEGLDGLPDHLVLRMARMQDKIIITQDGDFARYFYQRRSEPLNVIYVDLPKELRNIPGILATLRRFFGEHVESVDFIDTLVLLTEFNMRVVKGPWIVK